MSERYVQKQLQWPNWTWVPESDDDRHRRMVANVIGVLINLIFAAFYLGLILGYYLSR